MTFMFGAKQPSEAYFLEFDFTADLGVETIVTSTFVVIDQTDLSDVTTTLLDVTAQVDEATKTYCWVQDGTSGHDYLITCEIVGSAASEYELDGILPVWEIGIDTGIGLVSGPEIEPITLAEIKLHLRMDSGTFADNVDETQSIAPGNKAIADNYTTHAGATVEVQGYTAIVNLISGTNAATGTIDVKVQESEDDSVWTDWPTGAFTQVTTANDNAIYEKAYTGTFRYIRTVAKVLLATCDFGTTVIRLTGTTIEDDLLNDIITSGRELVEDITRRYIITQTWDYSIPEWPAENYVKLPGGNLQRVASIKWKDTDGVETSLTPTTDYLTETNGYQCGKVVLPYGGTWPSGTLYPSNPITIRYIAGWTTAALVPYKIKAALKLICADMYNIRESQIPGISGIVENKTALRLLASARLWDEF